MIGDIDMTLRKVYLQTVTGKELRSKLKGMRDVDRFVVCVEKIGARTQIYIESGKVDVSWKLRSEQIGKDAVRP